ncbi:Hpt domain-containing protein [Aurantibacter crassamenti]|uniref:Hpt domain-containing protein n=1 Tax=Aurantibacter crassamenti TaxID=1837375 RepID=UPI001939AA62|nr:Hpt domain-containing protein [Aurantibacter crassamenti]MBM1107475.1 Hpt domain-containing protein [Aurantibacter crassamenti]
MMETPNIKYIDEIAGDDVQFRNKFIEILKMEFPIEKLEYSNSIHNNRTDEGSQIVHKLKHKFSVLGLEESYRLAVTFEEELRLGNDRLKNEFQKVLDTIETYLKTI